MRKQLRRRSRRSRRCARKVRTHRYRPLVPLGHARRGRAVGRSSSPAGGSRQLPGTSSSCRILPMCSAPTALRTRPATCCYAPGTGTVSTSSAAAQHCCSYISAPATIRRRWTSPTTSSPTTPPFGHCRAALHRRSGGTRRSHRHGPGRPCLAGRAGGHDRDILGAGIAHPRLACTDLELLLRAHEIDGLVLCGIATSGAVLSTLREAAPPPRYAR
jgi:hypothetical protein